MYTRDEEEKCLAITIINTKKNQCFGSATKKSSKDNNFRSEYERKQMTREQQQRVKEKKKWQQNDVICKKSRDTNVNIISLNNTIYALTTVRYAIERIE